MFSALNDRFRLTLRTRILASTTGLLALAIIAAFTWSALNLRNILQDRNDRFLLQKLSELTTALHEQASDQTATALIAELRREIDAHSDNGLFAVLRRGDIADFFPDNDSTRIAERQIQIVDPNRRQTEITFGAAESRLRLIRSRPEMVDGVEWAIDLGMHLKETDATLGDFDRRLAFGGAAFLVLAFVGGVVLTGLSLRPIVDGINAARRLNPEDLSARLPLSRSGDELDQLAGTINVLLDRVAKKHEQMIRFTSDASHELRSPLAALRAAIEVSLQQPRSSDGYRELLGSLGEQCQHLTDLVNNLLLLARADSGQVAVELSLVDLALLVRESVEIFQPLMDEKELTLEYHVPDRLLIRGDQLRMRQLITNLLDNAIKFTNPRGTIQVDLNESQSQVELTISDTGIGIAPDHLPYIFDRFYRADESRVGMSTGLGLSICQWIVHAHNGTLSAMSELNRGTTLRIQLPS